ncbi:putative transcription factor LHW [Helianthus debilis subsp. tardiflorus]
MINYKWLSIKVMVVITMESSMIPICQNDLRRTWFYIEIMNVIRSFSLSILKSIMEHREEKIRVRFIVEAEAKRHVTRHELYPTMKDLASRDVSRFTITEYRTMFARLLFKRCPFYLLFKRRSVTPRPRKTKKCGGNVGE